MLRFMSQIRQNEVVWITGASTGIGRALALSFAIDGYKVAASARSADKLAELAAASANIKAYPLDVSDVAGCSNTVEQIERDFGPIELAIFNAGIWHPMTASTYDLDKVKASIDVNYTGVTNSLAPIMKAMIARGRGHLAIVSSVAGFRGLPKGAAYAPTKAALISLAESLYGDLKLKGVAMTVINPGFVETPMTSVNTFPMPFIVTTDEAVKTIRAGLSTGRFEIVFPGRMALLMKTLRILPYRLFFWATAKISAREKAPPEQT
jgi:short-subunit dehydrogenase